MDATERLVLDLLAVAADLARELHDVDQHARRRLAEVVERATSWPFDALDLAARLAPGGVVWDTERVRDEDNLDVELGRWVPEQRSVARWSVKSGEGGVVAVGSDGRVEIFLRDTARQLVRRRTFWVNHPREVEAERRKMVEWLGEQRRKGRVLSAAASIMYALERRV